MMRLEWIDDILAVLDSGSLAQAAEKRLLTQSAFTRRVRTIEENVGATLFDRRRKPLSLNPGVKALEPELREASKRLHDLRSALKTSGSQAGKPHAFVCQHALTATVSPSVVRALTANGETSVRVRSGNQDECLMQLLSREADFAIMYAVPEGKSVETSSAFEALTIGTDVLTPVCAPAMRAALGEAGLPVIAYPSEAFLGKVVSGLIYPRLATGIALQPMAETALTLAMLELVMSEIGVAWLPKSLVSKHLNLGSLACAGDILPTQALNIRIVRLAEAQPDRSDQVWHYLVEQLFSDNPEQTAVGGSAI